MTSCNYWTGSGRSLPASHVHRLWSGLTLAHAAFRQVVPEIRGADRRKEWGGRGAWSHLGGAPSRRQGVAPSRLAHEGWDGAPWTPERCGIHRPGPARPLRDDSDLVFPPLPPAGRAGTAAVRYNAEPFSADRSHHYLTPRGWSCAARSLDRHLPRPGTEGATLSPRPAFCRPVSHAPEMRLQLNTQPSRGTPGLTLDCPDCPVSSSAP